MMRYRDNRGYRYRLTNPPKALLKARLDNIAIVPASMLPLTPTLKEKVNTLPRVCRITELGAIGQRFQPKEHQVLVLG